MHTKKFDKGSAGRIKAHATRERDTVTESQIDESRTKYNVSLMPAMTDEQMQTYKDMAKRKDAVVLLDTILTIPEELKYASRAKQTAFFRCAYEALKEYIGGVPAFAEIHYDETSPHLHYGSIPITEDGRLCAKEVCNRKMLKGLHPTITKAVQEKGWEVTLYEENEEQRQIQHDLGMSKDSMHNYRKKQYHNQLLQEASETIDKNLQVAQKDLQRASRPVKRRKGETRAEYKERRSEWVEVRKEEYEDLRAFKMQFNTIPDKNRTEKAKEEAERLEEAMKQEHLAHRKYMTEQSQRMQAQQQELDRLIEKRAEQKADQKLREALERNASDYTKRLEEYCESVKYKDGTSVLDTFKEKEEELQKKIHRDRGWSR